MVQPRLTQARLALPRRLTPTPLQLRVTCPCGVATSVAAGGTVRCPCGRSWDAAVPAQDVAGVQSSMRRVRRRQARFVLNLVLAVGVLFLLRTSMPTLVLLPVFALLWIQLCRPWWKSRRQPVVTGVPTWSLGPATAPTPHRDPVWEKEPS